MRKWYGMVVLLVLVGCSSQPNGAPQTTPAPPPCEPEKVELAGLHNVFKVSDRVYSGNSPEDDTGFDSLKKLGVKTILTVDGSTPNVAAAERRGMRYVHLPIGYDGISDRRAAELAKAVRDLPGPVYVHCHHGQHRGPAACAAIQLALDPTWTPETAEQWLKDAGTDPKYSGLIGLPRTFKKPTAADLDAVPSDFPAAVKVPGLVPLMVEIDARWDHLKLVKTAGWQVPKDHPDIDPPHEVVQLVEHYREAQRLDDVKRRGVEFVKLMGEAESAVVELEKALRQKPVNPEQAGKAFTRSATACATCHSQFRDRPKNR